MSADHYEDFSRLSADAFGVKPTNEDIQRLFDTAAWGKEFIGYLAYTQDMKEVAAFYGIFPCYAEYRGKRYLAAQSGATMTHSQHRKKGLFFEAGKRTFELARAEGIRFVYGFPNPNSYPGLMKLGWSHDGNINGYHIFVPTLPLTLLASKVHLFERIYRRWFQLVSGLWRTKYSPFMSSARTDGIGTICHDDTFLAYRCEDDDRFMLRIDGCTVWVNRRQGSIGIGDIGSPENARRFKRILRVMKLFCFLSGSIHLRTYVSPGSELDRLFHECGYHPRTGLAMCHLDLGSELPLEKFKYVYADFDTF